MSTRTWRSAVALLGVAVTLLGCSPESNLPPPTRLVAPSAPTAPSQQPGATAPKPKVRLVIEDRVVDVDGTNRTYRIAYPSPIPRGLPLLVVLHGRRIDGAFEAKRTGFDALAQRGDAVVVYPNGLMGSWNAGGGCCDRPARERVDDFGLVTAVIPKVRELAQTDPGRTYVTGFSVGGMMGFTLACRRPDLVTALAVVAAVPVDDCPAGDPVSLLQVHGLADTAVPMEGTQLSGVLGVPLLAPPKVIDAFRERNGCSNAVSETGGGAWKSQLWAECQSGGAVQLTTVARLRHEYPRAASELIWGFVRNYRRAAA